MNNLQIGAGQCSRAPWEENAPIKAKVLVTITISKTVTIETTEYEKSKDEDGAFYEIEPEELEDCVYEQVTMPQDLAHVFKGGGFNLSRTEERALEDASGWEVDEINVEQA